MQVETACDDRQNCQLDLAQHALNNELNVKMKEISVTEDLGASINFINFLHTLLLKDKLLPVVNMEHNVSIIRCVSCIYLANIVIFQ